MKKKIITALCMILAFGCSKPKEPPILTGDWKEKGNGSSYHYAIITDNAMEIYAVSGNTRSLYWAGTFTPPETAEEPYTWESDADQVKMNNQLFTSSLDKKEFTYDKGTISYTSSIMGIETKRQLTKTSDEPSVDQMISKESYTQGELLQPNVVEMGGGLAGTSNYLRYVAIIENPNTSMTMRYLDYTVTVKDASGKVIASDSGGCGELLPSEKAVISGMVNCAGGIAADMDIRVICNANNFTLGHSVIPSSEFYFQDLSIIDKGIVEGLTVVGTIYNNSNTSTMLRIDGIYRKDGKIVYSESGYINNLLPGENSFELSNHSSDVVFDTVELFARDGGTSYNRTVDNSFTPANGLVNENVVQYSPISVDSEGGTASFSLSESEEDEKENSTDVTADNENSTTKPAETQSAALESTPEPTEQPETGSNSSFEDFKKVMDDYEATFDTYIELMENIDSSDPKSALLYMQYLGQVNEVMAELDALDESTMTDEELAYYTETMLRIDQKLLKAMN